MSKICPNCNKFMEADALFCSQCGRNLALTPIPLEDDDNPHESKSPPLPHSAATPIVQSTPTSTATPDSTATPTSTATSTSTETPDSSKLRFCTMCGGQIDHSTKRCLYCGKQYFSFKRMVTSKRFIIAVFSILLISSVVFSVIREQRDEIAYLERINGEEYVANVKNLESKLKFYEKYIVVVSDDGTKQYHTYGCSKFDGSSFWAFNIDAAVDKGYSPCSYCN